MTIKPGDWIKISKGTALIISGYSYNAESTKRDSVAQVKDVVRDSDAYGHRHYWHHFLTDQEEKDLRTAQWNAGNGWFSLNENQQGEILKPFREAVKTRLGLTTLDVVEWSDKVAWLEHVTPVAAPVKKKAEPKITVRQQMVKKSRWKITKDHDITIDITNPQIDADYQVWKKANPHPKEPPRQTVMTNRGPAIVIGHNDPVYAAYRQASSDWYDQSRAENSRISKLYPATIPQVIHQVKAGDVFEVMGKFETYLRFGNEHISGLYARIRFDGDSKDRIYPYSELKDIIEAESIPTVDIYVLRDCNTGQFMKSFPYGNSKYEFDKDENGKDLRHPVHGHKLGGHYVFKGMINQPVMVEKFMSAKHYDNLGKLKTSILNITGYYEGLNTDVADANRGYDTSYEKQMDLPESWEVVKFDKLARKEVDIIDIQAWYKRAYELRELTLQFGSSVRQVYKDLEKRNELDQQKGMIVFSVPDSQKEEGIDWGEKTALTPAQIKSVDDLIDQLGLKKGDYRRGKDGYTQAISFKDKSTAMLSKLSYNGTLKVSVLDLETLKEAVDD